MSAVSNFQDSSSGYAMPGVNSRSCNLIISYLISRSAPPGLETTYLFSLSLWRFYDETAGDDLYSGSIVKAGEMQALVTATGANTFFGRAASLVQAGDEGVRLDVMHVTLVTCVLLLFFFFSRKGISRSCSSTSACSASSS